MSKSILLQSLSVFPPELFKPVSSEPSFGRGKEIIIPIHLQILQSLVAISYNEKDYKETYLLIKLLQLINGKPFFKAI